MSGKYFWNDTDLASITGITSGTNYVNAPGIVIFNSLPGVKNTALSGFQTYTNFDISEPPFYDNGTSIFRNILVQSNSFTSGNGNISKPTWANACKIYVASKKGADGSAANGIASASINIVEHKNTNTNMNNNQNNNNILNRVDHNNNGWSTNENIRRNFHSNYAVDTGKTAKSGGSGYIIHTSKAITLTADDTIAYVINDTYNNLKIIRGGTTRATIRVYHGTDATNGTDAGTNTAINNAITAAPDNSIGTPEYLFGATNYSPERLNWEQMATHFQPYLQRDWNNTNTTLIASVSGTVGENGYNDTNSYIEFSNWNIGTGSTSETSPLIKVYWFKV